MTESPSDRPTRAPLFDPGPADEPAASDPPFWNQWSVWVGALAILAVALITLVILIPGQSREETLARRTAVKHWAELYKDSTETVDKYCEIRSKRDAAGDWVVDISRPIVPGSGGYQITTTFKVDRNGKSQFVGRSEDRIE